MKPKRVGKNYRLQSGINHTFVQNYSTSPKGLLLKGVVLATYVVDDAGHPKAEDSVNLPIAVYCDVLIYTNLPRQRWFTFSQVLVSQKRGGMHSDELWKPRAVSQNVVDTLNDSSGSNPGNLDGDHVLVGFMNDSFNEPVILRGIPHPARDIGNESLEVGKRLKLKVVDGDPDFVKHHGVYRGVDDKGNFIVNTTHGNDGTVDSEGKEPSPDTTGQSGNQIFNLPQDSKFEVVLWNMSNPEIPVEFGRFELQKNGGNIHFAFDEGETLKINGKDGETTFIMGDGAVKVAIADHLQSFYGSDLEATTIKGVFFNHTHPDAMGGTGKPTTSLPEWDNQINSDKMKVPDTG